MTKQAKGCNPAHASNGNRKHALKDAHVGGATEKMNDEKRAGYGCQRYKEAWEKCITDVFPAKFYDIGLYEKFKRANKDSATLVADFNNQCSLNFKKMSLDLVFN